MTDIVTTGGSNLPAPYTPSNEITAEDIALPRIRIAHPSGKSVAVKEELVKAGQIYSSLSQDDADPVVLHDPKKKDDEGVLVHVLQLKKAWSMNVDGDLESWEDQDPTRPEDAWRTYDYIVCLPEVDPDLPYKWLFTKSAKSAAQKINLMLKKNAAAGAHTLAFRITAAPRENDKGRWHVPSVKVVEADKKNVALAESLLDMVSSVPAAPLSAPTPAPEI